MKRIIAVIPTYNNPRGLSTLILNLSSSKYPLDIHIFDNSLDNLGVAKSWNQGLLLSKNNGYTIILNDDCIPMDDAIDKLISTAILHPEYTIISGCAQHDSDESGWGELGGYAHYSFFIINRDNLLKLQLFEKENYPNYINPGYFDENFFPLYFEDNDMRWRLKLAGLKEAKLTTALFDHTQNMIRHPEFKQGILSPLFIKNQKYYISKWGGTPGNEKYTTPFLL